MKLLKSIKYKFKTIFSGQYEAAGYVKSSNRNRNSNAEGLIFICDRVDKFNKDVAKFIFDTSDYPDDVLNEKFRSGLLSLIDATEKYEASRKKFDPVIRAYKLEAICDSIRGHAYDHK